MEDGVEKEDWMKKTIFLAAVALLAILVFAPVALAQGTTAAGGAMTAAAGAAGGTTGAPLPGSGGPSILLPAAALLLGSGVLTYAILRRR
jgi:hypothetical protein